MSNARLLDHSTNVNPADGITVTSSQGKISNVLVTGDQVTGTLNAAGTAWHSQWTLPVDTTMTVAVTATNSAGQTVHQTSTFKTLNPSSTFVTEIFEGYQQQYGVGMPIILTFNHAITNKAAVERALVISTSRPVVGAWYWDGDQTLIFRPRDDTHQRPGPIFLHLQRRKRHVQSASLHQSLERVAEHLWARIVDIRLEYAHQRSFRRPRRSTQNRA